MVSVTALAWTAARERDERGSGAMMVGGVAGGVVPMRAARAERDTYAWWPSSGRASPRESVTGCCRAHSVHEERWESERRLQYWLKKARETLASKDLIVVCLQTAERARM
jgi:hypothetical protein